MGSGFATYAKQLGFEEILLLVRWFGRLAANTDSNRLVHEKGGKNEFFKKEDAFLC